MPKSRTYTDNGFLEVQWSSGRPGGLICIVSGEALDPVGSAPPKEKMHQFTIEEAKELRQFAKALRRAMKQAHSKRPRHQHPCVGGSVCGEAAHCPP
jgi:hypothetical protein